MPTQEKKVKYRLGIDIGTNSIGTALVELREEGEELIPCGILHMGSRIFSDGREAKTKTSLAVARREARQARRRRDRYLRRRGRLMGKLIEYGLMPKSEEERKRLITLDPYALRAKGLKEKLTLSEFGRAIFHLNQRRGFKSNRKTDDVSEGGKIKSGIAQLKELMSANNAQTVGEYFYQRIQSGESVRARQIGQGAKSSYPFYLDRGLIADEFDLLWKKQSQFYSQELHDRARDEIRDSILFQRPLKPVSPGRCTFEWQEERCPIAYPIFQQFRIYQELNNLRIETLNAPSRFLTLDERGQLLKLLLSQKEVKFSAMKRKLNLHPHQVFNLEGERRDKLQGDQIGFLLSKKENFGRLWGTFDSDTQQEIVERLLNEENTEALLAYLVEKGVEEERAERIAALQLPTGYGSLSAKAIKKILPHLQTDIVTYDVAVERAGYGSHSQIYTGEVVGQLPYYGELLERRIGTGSNLPTDIPEKRYGKIANPTVHIALNQLRRVVNKLVKRFGTPEEIVVEVTRDLKLNEERKKELLKQQKENLERNKRHNRELEEYGQEQNSENRLRLQLWEELSPNVIDRRCTYTGKQISLSQLFSEEIEVEHIIPFSISLDDSKANKTLVFREANRYKGNRTPYQAFSRSPNAGGIQYDWEAILLRAKELPRNKSWRYQPDALERFQREGGFIARQLNDTAYISKVAVEYLQFLVTPKNVRAVPGRMTAMLRGKWGLDSLLGYELPNGEFVKNRDHHGHHAVDALVVALTDQGMLQKISRNSAKNFANMERVLAGFPRPWPTFEKDARAKLQQLVVSHRKDHGVAGQLHNDTAYGIVKEGADNGPSLVRVRKPFNSLKISDLDKVAGKELRLALQRRAAGLTEKEWEFEREKISAEWKIRRVRLLDTLSVIPIRNRNGEIYKAYKGDSNYCYDIWKSADGKRWEGRVVSTFEANQKGFDLHHGCAPDGSPLVMRLRNNDTLKLEGDRPGLYRVSMISEGIISMAEIFQGGTLREYDRMHEHPFKYLRKTPNTLRPLKARLVHIDEIGFVFDPGPPN